MDIERFHNELAMRLGYERIVNDKRILIYIEESEEPLVTVKVDGYDDITFKASEKLKSMGAEMIPELYENVKQVSEAVYEAYVKSISDTLACYNNGIH